MSSFFQKFTLIALLFFCFPVWLAAECDSLTISLDKIVRYALENQQDIEISEFFVESQAGFFQTAQGAFDPNLEGTFTEMYRHFSRISGRRSHKTGRNSVYDVRLNKLYRSGAKASVFAAYERTDDPLNFAPLNHIKRYAVGVDIEQPLLRGFMDNPESINERVTFLQWEASKYDMQQVASARINDAIARYWDLVAARKRVEIHTDFLNRLEELGQSVEELIKGGQLAKSEINQQNAEIAREARNKSISEELYYNAFNDLFFSIGYEPCSFYDMLPQLKLEPFPSIHTSIYSLNRFLSEAASNRGDLISLLFAQAAKELQLELAENNLLPVLNVRGGYNYVSQEAGRGAFLSPFPEREHDWNTEIHFSMPIGNNQAKGEVRTRQSELAMVTIQGRKLLDEIRKDIANAYQNHFSFIQQIKDGEEAVAWYEKAVNSEFKRMKEGYGTLFVLIDFENKLSDARLILVDSYRDYAVNLANLLFLSGMLVEFIPDICTATINIAPLLTTQPCKGEENALKS